MKIEINFKEVKKTEAIIEKVNHKSHGFQKFFKKALSISWGVSCEGGKFVTELKLRGPGAIFKSKASGNNLYHSFDLACDKIEKQIIKKIEKVKNKKHTQKKIISISQWSDEEVSWEQSPEDQMWKKSA